MMYKPEIQKMMVDRCGGALRLFMQSAPVSFFWLLLSGAAVAATTDAQIVSAVIAALMMFQLTGISILLAAKLGWRVVDLARTGYLLRKALREKTSPVSVSS